MDIKQCCNCGAEIDDNESFCPKCEAGQGKSFFGYLVQYIGYGTILLMIFIVGYYLFIPLTTGSVASTNPTVAVNANNENTVENKPVASQLTEEQKNIQTCEQIAKEYYENHKYEMYVYDCDNMAQDVWNMLYAKGIKSQIVIGNLDIEGDYTILDCNHAWVLAEVSEGGKIAIECTSGNVIYYDENQRYYNGFFFDDPQELRAYQAALERYYTTKAEYEAYINAYNKYVEEYNEADYYGQQSMKSGLLVLDATVKEREQAFLKAEMELVAILKPD